MVCKNYQCSLQGVYPDQIQLSSFDYVPMEMCRFLLVLVMYVAVLRRPDGLIDFLGGRTKMWRRRSVRQYEWAYLWRQWFMQRSALVWCT